MAKLGKELGRLYGSCVVSGIFIKSSRVIGTGDSVIITSFAVVESLSKYFSLLLYNIMDNREHMLDKLCQDSIIRH